jgi:malate dehydrogenase (oxaloacetate-decarboxylating)
MEERAIVFACANPVPEIWPAVAREAGAVIVATGRSDFPNQVNNSLVFPGLFRGVLDVRARKITDRVILAAMHELAAAAEPGGLTNNRILPLMTDRELPIRLAVAVGLEAQREGTAVLSLNEEAIRTRAAEIIERTRASVDLLTREGLLAARPMERQGINSLVTGQ